MIEPWDPLVAAYALLCAVGVGVVFVAVLYAIALDSSL